MQGGLTPLGCTINVTAHCSPRMGVWVWRPWHNFTDFSVFGGHLRYVSAHSAGAALSSRENRVSLGRKETWSVRLVTVAAKFGDPIRPDFASRAKRRNESAEHITKIMGSSLEMFPCAILVSQRWLTVTLTENFRNCRQRLNRQQQQPLLILEKEILTHIQERGKWTEGDNSAIVKTKKKC